MDGVPLQCDHVRNVSCDISSLQEHRQSLKFLKVPLPNLLFHLLIHINICKTRDSTVSDRRYNYFHVKVLYEQHFCCVEVLWVKLSVCLISLLKTFHHEGCKWSADECLWSSMQSVSAAWEVDVSRVAAILASRSITESLLPTALGFQFAACWKKSTGVKIFTRISFMFCLRALNAGWGIVTKRAPHLR